MLVNELVEDDSSSAQLSADTEDFVIGRDLVPRPEDPVLGHLLAQVGVCDAVQDRLRVCGQKPRY